MLAIALSQLLNASIEVVDCRPLGGGCISDVSLVSIRCAEIHGADIRSGDGNLAKSFSQQSRGNRQIQVVVKQHVAEMAANFRAESGGLSALAMQDTIRVPQVYADGVVDGRAYLVMQWIPNAQGNSADDRFQRFGQQLAQLHQVSAGQQIGWDEDNFLGSARQPNGATKNWIEFVATRRIGFQLRWAVDQGLADAALRSRCEQIVTQLDNLLQGRDDQTSMIHGDLWSGNYLFDDQDQPVLIDPAVYRGCREAEWGMIRWMGNCPAEFERGYQSQWPLADGWQRRATVYMLYHQLNHLNLFGSGYLDVCRRTADQILRV
ncbi:fructosamine kinase family protein [Stieleria sp. TO1_6]|uniref:fructosamine kinase family protein n=1 Tax=Stieleria tagensis TaxID=2956795 RepID=UPI00209B24B7|nr:fructosamine kinase family protein [Stieleria tagensis]MCO8121885.1 fructosamine kinase family protein [Stieleria tagensis]